MAQLSNADVALSLGMSHSSVSRMRSGERIASVETINKIATEYRLDDAQTRALLVAAAEGVNGRTADWVSELHRIFADGEIDEPAELVDAQTV